MVRGRDACWEHCVLVDATRQKVRCNYCQREFSGGVYRMKFHLAQIKNKDIVPCTEVPADVRDHIQSVLSTLKKPKTPKKQKADRAAVANAQQNSSSSSGGIHQDHGSSGQNGSACPSSLFPKPSPCAQPLVDLTQKQMQENADKKLTIFFFHNSISFNATKSMYYQEMVDAVAQCGVGYKAPSYEKLRSTLLEKVKTDIHNDYKRYKDEWKETGCTVLCDKWSDGRTRSLVVFSVACPKGTLFLKSVEVSGHEDDTNYLFELLESVVLEVGSENVVQVITDTSASYVYAGLLLMAKYKSLFWSPCAAYCIGKMIEDIGRLDWVSTVLEEAKVVMQYIHNHPSILNTMRKFTGRSELIRPKLTRFLSDFLSLRTLVIQEDNLKHMVFDSDWLSSIYSRRPDGQSVKSVLYSDRFWKHAHEAVYVAEPLITFLRMVDGDMPAMGYIYERIESAKVVIKSYYKGMEEKYKPILDIIDRRWNMQLHSSLHAAAAFLNPSISYNPNHKKDLRMRNGFQEAMLKMATIDKDKMEITKELPIYINAKGALGTDFAVLGRTLNAPGDWWSSYGYEIPTLQKAAIRILNQPCSSLWNRWNWSIFESVHNKKRNRVELEKFSDLVFLHCNLWLQAIFQHKEAKCGPVVFGKIDVNCEWPSEIESPPAFLDDSWLDDLPLECRESTAW